MFVWLDDSPARDPKGDKWTIVRTADEAIELLQTGKVQMISLDHDLEDVRYDPYPREITGMAVVDWMLKTQTFPKLICVHTSNVPAGKRMFDKLCDAWEENDDEFHLIREVFNTNLAKKLVISLEWSEERKSKKGLTPATNRSN